jgi:threonylcarbamoyladenosine tRNA methylthiotransferase MtaB
VLRAWPDAAIGTDLIVGFPGETGAHFESYFNFVESLPIAYFHVFPYSIRAGTTAAKFSGRVRPAEIKRRAGLMRALGERKRVEFARRFVGAKLKVLLEERGAGGELQGYSRNYVRVSTQGPDELTNREVEVEASTVEGAQLVGEIVRPWADDSVCRRAD